MTPFTITGVCSAMAGSDNLLQPKGSFCTSQSRVIICFQSLNLVFFFVVKHIHYKIMYSTGILVDGYIQLLLFISTVLKTALESVTPLPGFITFHSCPELHHLLLQHSHRYKALFGSLVSSERENSALWSHFSLLRVGLCLECWSQRRKLHPSPLKPCLL